MERWKPNSEAEMVQSCIVVDGGGVDSLFFCVSCTAEGWWWKGGGKEVDRFRLNAMHCAMGRHWEKDSIISVKLFQSATSFRWYFELSNRRSNCSDRTVWREGNGSVECILIRSVGRQLISYLNLSEKDLNGAILLFLRTIDIFQSCLFVVRRVLLLYHSD